MTKIDGIELSEDEIDLAHDMGLEDFLEEDEDEDDSFLYDGDMADDNYSDEVYEAIEEDNKKRALKEKQDV